MPELVTPRWRTTGCSRCSFVGRHLDWDIYWCTTGNVVAVGQRGEAWSGSPRLARRDPLNLCYIPVTEWGFVPDRYMEEES